MKEGAFVAEHLNEFHVITSQLAFVKITLDDEIRDILLMCSMPDSWENLIVASNTSAPAGTLNFDNVSSSLMNEELQRKSISKNQGGEALALSDHGRKIECDGRWHSKSRGRSKSSNGRIICHHCRKCGHIKNNCWIWKKEQKGQKEQKVTNNNNEETIVVASEGEVLTTVSYEDACLYASNHDNDWILDFGASYHATPSRENCISCKSGNMGKVWVGNKSLWDIKGVGDVIIKTKDGSNLLLKQVRHILELGMNLISTGILDDEEYHIVFGKWTWKIIKGALVVAKWLKVGTLYTLKENTKISNVVVVAKEGNSVDLWHKRLGHMSERGLKILVGKNLILGLKSHQLNFCEHCIYGKQQKVSFMRGCHEREANILELVYSDVCGLINVKSLGGASYFVTFIDDASKKVWAYPMKNKGEVFEIFQNLHVVVERETNKLLKCLRTNNCGKYCSNAFKDYLIGLA